MTTQLPDRIAGGLTTRAAVPPRNRNPEIQDRAPSVSVVIPCYNYARFVDAAIRSALSQQGVSVDVVVVDDASTDASADVAEAVASTDDRVRVVRRARNGGPVATFNEGMEHATGDYLVRLDADDLLTPGSLARSTAVAEAYPTVGLVYGRPLHFSSTQPPPARAAVDRWLLWPGHDWLADRVRTGVNVITSPEVLMRRSIVDLVGGQRDLAHSHDFEMWLRLATVSDVAYVQGPDQAWHREHPTSLSTTLAPLTGDLEERRLAFTVLFDWSEDFLPQTAELRSVAGRRLAAEAAHVLVHLDDVGQCTPDAAAALRAFAEAADPSGAGALWARAEARMSPLRTVRLGRRALGRVRNEVSARRWHRRGEW
ncbi:glycosyltransferase family 2 protein [Xylanimonas sp. McL0601]|uniref:glycosyltransferase family 2 protein n=1 Tax=Xylanimonas sp. McL0601 TaxID=3414739 RepID=UPI003CFA13F9